MSWESVVKKQPKDLSAYERERCVALLTETYGLKDELEAVACLDAATNVYICILSTQTYFSWFAKKTSQVVGLALFKGCRMTHLSVASNMRHKGIGGMIVARALSDCHEVTYLMNKQDQNSTDMRDFLVRQGFTRNGQRSGMDVYEKAS